MKKNAGKIVRLLVIAVMTAVIAGALGVTASAKASYEEEITRYVDVEYPLPVNTRENNYGLPGNYLGFSDPSMVLVDGKPAPKGNFFVYPKGGTMKFIKAGELKMLHQWQYYDGTVAGNDNPLYQGFVSYIVTVKEKETFSGNIKVTYDEPFVAGKPFPKLKVESKGDVAKFRRAWFEITGAGTHDDEVIPDYYAGVEAEINVELEPTEAYFFGWVDDGERYWSPALSDVTVNGKKVDASVFTYKKGNTLHFSFPVTIGAEVKEIKITDLDVPAHGQELDRTATASVGTVTAVRYEMFRKEINEVSKGDNIGVGVNVKLPEGYTFAEDSYAVWNGQVSEYKIRTPSMGTDEYLFVFPVTVGVFGEQAYINSGSVYFIGDAMLKVGARVPDRKYFDSEDDGIIYGEPVWTPAHKTFESGQTYTVKIPLSLEKSFLWTDDILTNHNFSIESKDAEIVAEGETSGGGKQKFENKYYLVATFTPEDIEGQEDVKYFDLELSYSKQTLDLKVGDKVTVTAQTNIDPMLATDLKVQWYSSASKVVGSGIAVKGATATVLTIPTDKVGSQYYYCEISCTIGDEKSRLTTVPMPVLVNVTEKGSAVGKYTLRYSDDAAKHVVIYSSEEDFSFEVKADNASANIRYAWYQCDRNGKLLNNTVLGNGQALLMHGIKNEDMYKTFYYTCIANDNEDIQSLVFSCLLLPKKNAFPFKDVFLGDPYYGSVWYTNNHDPLLMYGVADDLFSPMGNLTRAAIVTVLYRLEGSPATVVSDTFSDVPAGQWYSEAVAWAVESGIANGYGDGRFGPNNPITREQLAAFLHRYAKSRNMLLPVSGTLNQPDAAKVDAWAIEAMTWAYSKGIIEEVDGNLAPLDNALRHMIATALTRFCIHYSM